MSEPAERSGAARLDELAAVTTEYARYASERSGIACSAVGAGWVAVFVLALVSPTWARIAALWSPILTIGLVWVARRYYQRFGSVLPAAPTPRGAPFRWRKPVVWLALVVMASVVVSAALHHRTWSGGSVSAELGLLLVLASAPAVPLLVERVIGASWDDGLVVFSLGVAQTTAALTGGDALGWLLARLVLGVTAAAGIALVGVGAHQHLSYRRLERRLAALKGTPA